MSNWTPFPKQAEELYQTLSTQIYCTPSTGRKGKNINSVFKSFIPFMNAMEKEVRL